MECCNCKRPVGDGPKRAPVHVGDGAATEVWCAICFCHKRAPMEVGRFPLGAFTPVQCSRCGWESADFGLGRCPQCQSRFCMALGPIAEPA